LFCTFGVFSLRQSGTYLFYYVRISARSAEIRTQKISSTLLPQAKSAALGLGTTK
jgi:hypothetical protein